MPVVVGGWDSIENFLAALERGETPGVVPAGYSGPVSSDFVVQPALAMPVTAIGSAGGAIPTSSGFGSPLPGVMTNIVASSSFLGGAWSGFNPNDLLGGLAIIHAYMQDVYGSVDLGQIRWSSEVLENEPTGIRPGVMERIVIPSWARLQRGSPL